MPSKTDNAQLTRVGPETMMGGLLRQYWLPCRLSATSTPSFPVSWMLTSVYIPAEVDDAAGRCQLLEHYNIEIGAGLGPWRGKVWRRGFLAKSLNDADLLPSP